MNITTRVLFFCLVGALTTSTTYAQSWTGAGDGLDWHDAANWSSGAVPVSGNDFPDIFGFSGNSFNAEINQALDVGQVLIGDSTLTINAATTSSTVSQAIFADADSIINMNADVEGIGLGGTDAVLNMNSGTMTGDFDVSGTNAQFNRSGGTLQLDSLSLSTSGTSIAMTSGDSVSESVSASSDSTLTINGATVSGGVNGSSGSTITLNSGSVTGDISLDDSTFNWDGGALQTDRLSLTRDAVFNRNGAGTLSLDFLEIFDNDSDFELTAGDSIENSFVDGTGTLDINGGSLGSTFGFNELLGYTVNLNSGSVSGGTFINGGVFNWNGGSFSGSLSLGPAFDSNHTPTQFNRNGSGALNLTSLSLSGSTSLDLVSGDSVSGSTSVRDSDLTVDGATLEAVSVFDDGTVNFNSGSATSVSVDDATFNWNGGTLGSTLDLSNDAVFNRNATGSLALTNLSVFDSDLVLQAGDSSSSTYADSGSMLSINGATLTIYSEFDRGSVVDLNSGSISGDIFLFGGTLNMNGGDLAGSLFLDESSNTPAQFNRGSAGTVSLTNLDATDVGSIELISGDSVSGVATLVRSNIDIAGAIINEVAASNGTVTLSDGSVDRMRVTNGLFDFQGGDVNQLTLNNGSTFDRSSGTLLDAETVSIVGASTSVDLIEGDVITDLLNIGTGATVDLASLDVDRLTLGADTTLNVIQALGQTDGITFDTFNLNDSSAINILFDSAFGVDGELDYGLAVLGDQTSDLQTYLDNGQITFSGNQEPVGIFFDAGTNRTSIGYFAVAVPEPSSLVFLGALATGFFLRRRRYTIPG